MFINFVYDYDFIEACVKLLVIHPYFPDILKDISVQAKIQFRPKVSYRKTGLFSLETFLVSLDVSRFSRESLNHLV